MKAKILLILVIAMTSCNAFAPEPTITPTLTATSLPTSTVTSSPMLTFTPEPTITPTPTKKPTKTPAPPTDTPSAPIFQMPTGTPLTNWNGIPVMPDAIAGEGTSDGYFFSVAATAEAIQSYYEKELPKLGWNLFAVGQGETDAILLIFMKGTDTVTVSILPQQDGPFLVLLFK
jgi:hypothetical protein